MDTDKIIKELDNIYGSGKGEKVYLTIIPGILADFHKMLKKTSI